MVKKIDEIPVNYIDEGEGEVVLLLHGWGANITLYRGIIDTLKQGRRVIALDMPGFGKPPEPPAKRPTKIRRLRPTRSRKPRRPNPTHKTTDDTMTDKMKNLVIDPAL